MAARLDSRQTAPRGATGSARSRCAAADAQFRAFEATDLGLVQGLEVTASGDAADVGATPGSCDVLQEVLVEAAQHEFASAVLLESTGGIGHGRAIGGADAHDVDMCACFCGARCGVDRVSGVVLPIRDQDDGLVCVVLHVEQFERHVDGGAHVGASSQKRLRGGVPSDEAQRAVVHGQGHAGVRATREDHHPHAVAGHHVGEVEQLASCALHPVRVDVLGTHGQTGVENHHDVQTFPLEFLPPPAPSGTCERDDDQREGCDVKDGACGVDAHGTTARPPGRKRAQFAQRPLPGAEHEPRHDGEQWDQPQPLSHMGAPQPWKPPQHGPAEEEPSEISRSPVMAQTNRSSVWMSSSTSAVGLEG